MIRAVHGGEHAPSSQITCPPSFSLLRCLPLSISLLLLPLFPFSSFLPFLLFLSHPIPSHPDLNHNLAKHLQQSAQPPLQPTTSAMAELTKVDSAVAGLSIKDEKDKKPRRGSAEGVYNIKELEEKKIELTLPIETQKTGWKLNTSPSTVEDKDILKLYLVNPPVKKIDLHFPLGLEVTARNMKGVTIKDALDAIYKQFKKKADDELDNPYLAGFEWDKDECWTRLIVHQKKHGEPQAPSGKKSKKKNKEEA